MSRRKKVTMADIADRLEISVVTVSKALAGKDGVGPVLRNEIMTLAAELGYVQRDNVVMEYTQEGPSNKRKNLNIGILVAKHFFQNSNSFYFDLYQMFVSELMGRGHFGIVEIVGAQEERLATTPHFIVQRHVAGVIVLGQFDRAYLEMLEKHGIPLIFVDFTVPGMSEDAVVQDNLLGAYQAVSYLIAQGHREIAFVGSVARTSSIMERYLGYHRAMLEHGLVSKFEKVIEDRGADGIYIEMELPGRLPTALFCNSDETAYVLMKQMGQKGIRIPQDVSIFGFDDSWYAKSTDPKLSTISVDREAMTRFAVSGLLKKIEKQNDAWLEVRKVINVKMHLRDSVRPAHTADTQLI